jgi:hypothetical protein
LDIDRTFSQADEETTVLEKVGNKKCQVASKLPSVERAKDTKAPRGIIRLLKIKEDGDKLLAQDETVLDLTKSGGRLRNDGCGSHIGLELAGFPSPGQRQHGR